MESKFSLQHDRKLRILTELYDTPIPAASPIASADYFLESNKRDLLSRLQWSRLQLQKTRLSRFAAVCCAVIALGAVFAFSPDARAFASRVFTAITEWFSPAENLSGITFEIDSDAVTPPELPETAALKITFDSKEQASSLLPGYHVVLGDPRFELEHGFMADDVSYTRYTNGDAVIKIIQEPIQQAGSISVTFLESRYQKNDTAGETIYYTLTDGDLFGIMISDTAKVILIGEALSADQLTALFRALSTAG